jgi:hypothetical protein
LINNFFIQENIITFAENISQNGKDKNNGFLLFRRIIYDTGKRLCTGTQRLRFG